MLDLAPAIAPLRIPPREAFARVADLGLRHVQLSATQPGLRPRELDRSARRDVVASLRRRGLAIGGIDLWIPPAHFAEADRVDRAMEVALATIDLAGDLADARAGAVGRPSVVLELPRSLPGDIVTPLAARGVERGVAIADHGVPALEVGALGLGIDPASWLGADQDPIAAVSEHAARLVSARLGELATLDLVGYRVALEIARPPAPIVLDARAWPDPAAGLTALVDAWVSAVPTPGGAAPG